MHCAKRGDVLKETNGAFRCVCIEMEMQISQNLAVYLMLTVLLAIPCVSYGQIEGTFIMPNSTLLFETTEISPTRVPFQELVVVSTGGAVVVRSPAGFLGEDYNTVFPALAPGADRVAWGLSKHG